MGFLLSGPSAFVIGLVLTAAFLHALWNALIKGSSDRALTMGMLNFGHAIIGLIMVLIFLPPSQESWYFIIGSTIIHFFYFGFLLVAYRSGDLSQVYPIARGVAPVLVAISAQLFAGEVLPPTAWFGVLLVSGGIGFLFFGRNHHKAGWSSIAAALLTGLTIASYSVVDGMGVRVSGSPFGYIGWLFLLEAIPGTYFFLYRRKALPYMKRNFFLSGLAGGFVSALAYGMAIYAAGLTNLATVSAIRESSVIIAALIGVMWFGERPWKLRVIAAIIVATGVIVLTTA
jgi:drug/metabolite transporter (DMT)-like permease